MGSQGWTPVDESTPQGWTPVDESRPAVTSGDPGKAALQSGIRGALEYPKEFGKGIARGATNLVQGTGELMKPRNPNEVQYGPTGRFLLHLGQDTASGLGEAYKASAQSRDSGENWAGQTLSFLEKAPLIGGAIQYGEQGGPGYYPTPKSVGAAAELGTYVAAPKVTENAISKTAEFPTHVNDFLRRSKSLSEVAKAGTGVYQGKIQPTIQKLQGAIRTEATNTLAQAVQADTLQSGGQGTISGVAAHATAHDLMDKMGYTPNPQVVKLLDRLNGQPAQVNPVVDQTARAYFKKPWSDLDPASQAALSKMLPEDIRPKPSNSSMTLEDAKNLRSDIGETASRTKDAQLQKVLWGAYKELGDGMGARVKELQGTTKPFDHYNNEFRAYYDLRKGITGEMLDPLEDRHDSIEKLKKFSDADLTEIKDRMKKYGMNPGELDDIQKNARSVAAAHDSISGKYKKSLYRLALSGGSSAAVALPLAVYAVARGAGLYGLVPLLAASYVGSRAAGVEPEMETGRILHKLKIDPDKWNVRTPVEGPQQFQYPDVPGGGSTGAGGGGSPSSPAPTTPSGITTSLDEPTEAMRPNLVDPAREKAQIIQQTRQNLRAAVDRAKDSGNMAEWSRAKQELAAYDARGLDVRGRKAEDIERLKTRKAGKPR